VDQEEPEAREISRLMRHMLALNEMVDGLVEDQVRWDELRGDQRNELVAMSQLANQVNDDIIRQAQELGYCCEEE
jgi:hypothetical protein